MTNSSGTGFWHSCLITLFLSIPVPLYAMPTTGQDLKFVSLNVAHGLSQNSIGTMVQDHLGFIWMGTQDGLNCFDGYTARVWRSDSRDLNSLQGNYIECLMVDRNNNVWVGTRSGLSIYMRTTGVFERILIRINGKETALGDTRALIEDQQGRVYFASSNGVFRYSPQSREVEAIAPDLRNIQDFCWGRNQKLWLCGFETQGQSLYRLDPSSGEIENIALPHQVQPLEGGRNVRALHLDRKNRLWVAAESMIFYFEDEDGPAHFYTPGEKYPHTPVKTHQFIEDRQGNLWLATYGKGLYHLDPAQDRLTWHPNREGKPDSLGTNNLLSVMEDHSGLVWVGTDGEGARIYNPSSKGFQNFGYEMDNPNSLSLNAPAGMNMQPENVLWIGTFGGGLNRLDLARGQFTHFRHDPQNARSLASDQVVAIIPEGERNLWIATFAGIDHFEPDTGTFTNYAYGDEPDTLSNNNVICMAQQPGTDYLWVGTLNGVNRLDTRDGRVTRIKSKFEPGSFFSNGFLSMIFDRYQRLWVGSTNGIYRMDSLNSIQAGLLEESNGGTRFEINSIFEDQRGIWLATNNGLGLVEHDDLSNIRIWNRAHGLTNEFIYGILKDGNGMLWLSSNGGLFHFDPNLETFKNYTALDGLQSNEFNGNSFFKAGNGIMYFGGIDGISWFDPHQIRDCDFEPPVIVNELRIANQRIQTRFLDPSSPLNQTIDQTSAFTLNYKQNFFSLGFASLDFGNPQNNRYAYILEGYHQDWIPTTAGERLATFTNLPAGNYTFRVKGSNRDGIWSPHQAAVRVTIKPPPWLSWWAITLYLLFVLAMLRYYLLMQRRKLEQERCVSERLRQLDKLKDEFLANTSHELRTPLHGIIGLAEALRDGSGGQFPEQVVQDLSMIVASGRRLATLVDDILDYSKMKKGLKLRLKDVNPHKLAATVLELTRPLIAGKPLELINRIEPQGPLVVADEDRLLQILHNLVGNAARFTLEGRIEVSARVIGNMLEISVSDTGIGIPLDQQQQIFESFVQADGTASRKHGGTGLGLAVSRDLVAMHGGEMSLLSKPDQGSVFSFSLPLADVNAPIPENEPFTVLESTPISPLKERIARVMPSQPVPLEKVTVQHNLGLATILVVDDNQINRRVLANHLNLEKYQVLEAACGQDALDMLKQQKVDLVLLDVMMPGLSGFEVCQLIRREHPVHDLPVIFLTAKNLPADKTLGFGSGANDFLTKPVNKEELLSRVKTHLQLLFANRGLEEAVAERTRHLATIQKELVEAAHTSGMAEIASEVLHTVGNSLNSLGTSLQLIEGATDSREAMALFHKIVNSIQENSRNLAGFFEANPQALSEALSRIYRQLEKSQNLLLEEGRQLRQQLTGLRCILQNQEHHLACRQVLKPEDLNRVVQETMQMADFSVQEDQITLAIDLARDLPPVMLRRSSLVRVLLCLLQNAQEAIQTGKNRHRGRILVRTLLLEQQVQIEISDNGIGIPPESRDKVFTFGFSSKQDGKGFGLHYSANCLQEMNASIQLTSSGRDRGAIVLLKFPP